MSKVEHPPQCIECGSSQKETVQHHVSYADDETVPVCLSCHQQIHADKDHPLFPEDEPDLTTVGLTDELADELHSRKSRGDSYEDVIWRLIEEDDDE